MRTSRPSRRTPRRTRTNRGSAAAAGHCRTSRAGSPTAVISIASCRNGRPTWRAATATPPGSTRGRSSSPGSASPPRTRPTDGSSETPTAGRRARSRRRRRTSCVTCSPRRNPGSSKPPSALHRPSCTVWASRTGRTPIVSADQEELAYVTLASRGELTARVVGALVVGRCAWRRADRRARRAPSRADGLSDATRRRASSS